MMKEFFYSKRNKISLTGIGVFAIYSLITLFRGLPLQLLGITNISETGALIYSLLISIILVGIISYIYADKLRDNFDDLKNNHKKYFSKYLKYWLFALLFMALSNLLILTFTVNDLPMNEEVIRGFFGSNPIIVFLSAVFVAPILEELVFRQGFRDMFADDTVFIFMSALTFGALHVVGTATSFVDLIYIIPYAVPAIAFGLMLKETDNVLVPIGFHFVHNGVLIALQFILLIFG